VFHRVGSGAAQDEVIFDPDDPEVNPDVSVSPDGRYLVLSLGRGIGPGVELRVLDLQQARAGWRVLLPACDAQAQVVACRDATFYLLTDDGADTRRIVAIDLARPGRPDWREIVPSAADVLLEAHLFGGRLVCHYLREACSRLAVFELDGTFVRDIPLPDLVTLGGSLVARADRGHRAQRPRPLRGGVVHRVRQHVVARPALG
jgi:prolyl oligopeptidase